MKIDDHHSQTMKKSISKEHSEFSKLDRVDRLVCLHLVEKSRSWNEITSFVVYLKSDYQRRSISIREFELVSELKQLIVNTTEADKLL